MPQDTKKWYQSKTIWFNVITFLLGGFGALDPQLMPQWFPEAMVTVNLVGNILLRSVTAQKLQ